MPNCRNYNIGMLIACQTVETITVLILVQYHASMPNCAKYNCTNTSAVSYQYAKLCKVQRNYITGGRRLVQYVIFPNCTNCNCTNTCRASIPNCAVCTNYNCTNTVQYHSSMQIVLCVLSIAVLI